MGTDVRMPPLSQTLDTLVLVQWLKQVGDPVAKGEPLFTVETDKATLEVEAPADGRLAAILAQPGEEVRTGAVIGRIAGEGEALMQAAGAPGREEGVKPPVKVEPPDAASRRGEARRVENAGFRERILASPRARRRLDAAGAALADLRGRGSGPLGAVVERDVLAYLAERRMGAPAVEAAAAPAALPGRGASAAGLEDLRGSYAAAFTRQADAARLLEVRERILERLEAGQPRPEAADFLALIACRLLARYPTLNARVEGDRAVAQAEVHLALGVEGGPGMLFPVVRAAGRLGLFELARARLELAERARQGRLRAEELSGATFTLIDLGASGVDQVVPALVLPQAAALAAGWLKASGARPALTLVLSCDLRATGARAPAGFLKELVEHIEAPEMTLALT